MCIFCGDFISSIHWTDRTKNSDKTKVIVGELQRDRQRERLVRANLCNQILQHYQLKLRDWNNTKFILEDAKGNSRIIHDLNTLWYEVHSLIGKSINPLDDYFIKKFNF
ncbi:hypothetical protein [Lysinibacillus sp. NPDC056232]|uniref:hypothetical protein n=1 Tax=Lysinibacillus sp. NPDC056232 TaxID=3345756 RepID=UPI0035E0FEAB